MHVRMTRGIERVCRLVLLLALPLAGCVIQVPTGPSGTDGTGQQAPPTSIVVRIVNDTDRPLDPQIYVGPPGGAAGDLFVVANKRTDFGVGKLGTLLAKSETSLVLECGKVGYFGTAGGIFGDDLNNPAGGGRPITLQEGANVWCGGEVTIWFENNANTLITTFAVTSQGG